MKFKSWTDFSLGLMYAWNEDVLILPIERGQFKLNSNDSFGQKISRLGWRNLIFWPKLSLEFLNSPRIQVGFSQAELKLLEHRI